MIIKGTRQEMIVRATELIKEHIEGLQMVAERVVLAVPGGRNVAEIFFLLREADVAWNKVEVFMLDERLVPTDHQESNFRQVDEILSNVIDKDRLHPFTFQAGDPAAGVKAYNECLQACGGKIDIVLASSGEDGHIASLFPSHPSITDKAGSFILVKNSPKPPPERISASAACIQRAQVGIVLFFGEEKLEALKNYCDPAKSYLDCPAKLLTTSPAHYVLTDQEVQGI